MKLSGVAVSAVLALCAGAAGAIETIPDEMVLGVVRMDTINSPDGRLLVCPPGSHRRLNRCGTSPAFDGRRDNVAAVTPQVFLQQACPGVKLVSISVDYWGMQMASPVAYGTPQSATLITSGACAEQSKSKAE